MANQRQDQVKESRWREIIQRQAASGLSIRRFCQQEQLREPAFYAWRRTIRNRERAGQLTASEPDFVPATVTSQPPNGASMVLELAGGLVLRLPESITADRLAELVHALQSRGNR